MSRDVVLSDRVWARIEPLLPPVRGRGRPFRDHRQVVEGIAYRYRAGIPWRDLPERFGPWRPVWKRHHRFAVDGTWEKVLTDADAAGEGDWAISVDSTIARVHQHGGTAAGTQGAEPA